MDALFDLVPWMSVVVLLAGFVPLVKGADWLVDGAAALAARLRVPPLVIGLTVVAFGTSTPELVVNLFAAVSGSTDIALGNVVGSNIFNTLAILGVSSLIAPLVIQKSTIKAEVPLNALAAGSVVFLAWDGLFLAGDSSILSRGDGLVFLIFFAIFLYYNYDLASRGQADAALKGHTESEVTIADMSTGKSLLFIVLGLAGLVLGGKLIVDGAVRFASDLGVAQRVIGLTIVSIGTSLPELVTSVVAARKGQSDIAVGNIVGSNIFNTFFILGITAVVLPVPLREASQPDLLVNAGTALLLWVFIFLNKQSVLRRYHGVVFLASYVGYTVWLLNPPSP